MNRRLVLSLSVLGLAAAGSVTAYAGQPQTVERHHNEVCVVLAQDPQGSTTKDFCVTWPGSQTAR